jgi:putative phosphoribosyl transferase
LNIPADARGAVLFAHGSGSSRHSPRNKFVADELAAGGFATMLFDLLTADEDAVDRRTGEFRFDVDLLARRLLAATAWAREQPQFHARKFGYFGASTGAAAALVAAATLGDEIAAVVSRGGRPDLAGRFLGGVRAPTRLIVGAEDPVVLQLNRQAARSLKIANDLIIVPGATHLFEEAGALETVARHARAWFNRYLAPGSIKPPHGGN